MCVKNLYVKLKAMADACLGYIDNLFFSPSFGEVLYL
jgi:hypothetical protein